MERNFLILSHYIINVTGYRHIPGWITFSTHGWDSKNLATANPFFMCSFILTCRVFRPLFTKKLSKGEGTAPKAWIIKMVCSSLTFKLGNSLIYMYRYPYFLCISFWNSHLYLPFWRNLSFSHNPSSFNATAPITTSECPTKGNSSIKSFYPLPTNFQLK